MRLSQFFIFLISFFLIYGCSSSKKIKSKAEYGIGSLRFINEYIVPNGMQFKETTVGGLSGIDYDKAGGVYYMICDDPSARSPARFYTAKLLISKNGIDSVVFMDVATILNAQGKSYPDINKDRIHSADLEAMRYDPVQDILIRSSEGQRIIRDGKQELQNPDIVMMDRNGRYIDSFSLPANLYIQSEEKGPRHNSVFEGLTFADDNSVYISLEDAIYEDGRSAGTGDSTSWTRFLKFDRRTKKQSAQFAYQLDAVSHVPVPPGAFKINGVSDILYIGNDKFIVIERGYSTGRLPSDIRVYLADIKNAGDISAVSSLTTQPVEKPITKKLLLNMNELDIFIDNIEGVTFGPVLPNGHRSLIFVSDNNFSPKQKTQFLLFEVLP